MNYRMFEDERYCRSIDGISFDHSTKTFNTIATYLLLSNDLKPDNITFSASSNPLQITELTLHNTMLVKEGQIFSAEEFETKPEYQGWNRNEKIERYLEGINANGIVLQNDVSTIIVTEKYLTSKQKTAISGIIPKICPWIFPKDFKLSEENKRFFVALTEENEETLKELLSAQIKKIDEIVFRSTISKMFEARYESAIIELAKEIDQLHRNIESWTRSIANTYDDITNKSLLLEGMKLNNSVDGIEDFFEFIKVSNIDIIKAERENITFRFNAFLDSYDLDNAKAVLKNPRAEIYKRFSRDEKEEMVRILSKIFIDRKYKLKVYAEMIMSSSDMSLITSGGIVKDGRIANPHLQRYSCWSRSHDAIIRDIRKGDYLSAMAQARFAVGNVSFADVPVMEVFSDYLNSSRNQKLFVCVEDGSEYSLEEICSREE